ncbi:MAG TPA: hypothetical protein DDX91_03845 [Ruminococcaceae bacterium]|nr:hypothetical protein [Oscillospiraceae bacterium]
MKRRLLLRNKGFSLTEMIVVIAIIVILTAILVPALSNSSSYETEAMENARAFYSNVQQVMIQEKFDKTLLNDDPTKTANKKYTLVYAEVNTDAATTVTVKIGFTDDELKESRATEPVFTDLKECSDTYLKDLTEFSSSVKNMLMTNQHGGYFYAVVDDKYRVVSTYYSAEGDFDSIYGKKFSDDFRIDAGSKKYITASYPYNILEKDDPVFVDPNAA